MGESINENPVLVPNRQLSPMQLTAMGSRPLEKTGMEML